MKKLSTFLIPAAVLFLVFTFFKRLMASGAANPMVMLGIIMVTLVGSFLLRPKKKSGSGSADTTLALLGDFSKDAFSYDESLSTQFQSSVTDFLNSMPKAAAKKLEKLQGLCKTDADTYAVCIMMGMLKSQEGDYSAAIKLFNKAVVLHPTAELADAIGSAHQRIGELDEAIDSYEFALDLDPEKIDIRAKVATAYVGNGDFLTAIDHAQQVLDLQADHASALATIAICHGCMDNTSLYEGYTAKAVEAGYSEQKITSTVPALKKKFKKTLESMN
jgi:tetratricopeptide (TPR) repeat protein